MFTGFFEWENIQALHYSFEWTPDMNIKTLLFVLLWVFSTSVQAQKSIDVQAAAAASPQANSLEQRKAKLEGDKLEVEIERLKRWYGGLAIVASGRPGNRGWCCFRLGGAASTERGDGPGHS